MAETAPTPSVVIDDILPCVDRNTLARMILDGLEAHPRRISSRFFYDATGSKLFEEITRLPEYYLTRTEVALLREVAQSLRPCLPGADIIELGSGGCEKISVLLDAVDPSEMESVSYVPVDVSRDAVVKSADVLVEKYPRLSVHGYIADFFTHFLSIPRTRRRLICFFGSTFGNLTLRQRTALLASISRGMMPGDEFVMGVDMVKERDVLERAYNDRRQVTATFNRNILNVANALAGTDFSPDSFAHVAEFNEQHSRMEMRLKALRDLHVCCPSNPSGIRLAADELILTELSHKFTFEGIERELCRAGLVIDSMWTDDRKWFTVLRSHAGPSA